MISLIRGELGGFMNQHNLNEYLASIGIPEVEKARQREAEIMQQARKVIPPSETPPEPRIIPPAPAFTPRPQITNLFTEFAQKFTSTARERGVELRWIGVGTWKTPVENVISKHRDAWILSRANRGAGSDDAIMALNRETTLNKMLGLIQEIPLGSYHQAATSTSNHHVIMRTVLADYRKQLILAKDSWTNKREPIPQNIEDAIRHLDDVLWHFAGRDPGPPEEVIPPDEDGSDTEQEVNPPNPVAPTFDELVRLVGGDESTANRLIEHERNLFPDGSLENLIERAIERLIRDRQ
jgi:hypothetical protein